ncbi:MAG: hypothetical protein FGM32_09605 [Candidatus Kapabacteria bacterium]|nr:hypothetical protein [Candidatus Kapabacteria bacterium]
MKRFLIIAAAAVTLAACSQTGVVEPVVYRSNEFPKPGREKTIAKTVREPARGGRSFPPGEWYPGQPLKHEWKPDALGISCVMVQGRCYETSADGSFVDIFYRPLIAIDSAMPSIERTLKLVE